MSGPDFRITPPRRRPARHQDWDICCKVYVGGLGNSASKTELEAVFSKYGPLKNVWVARNPPGFAFVEYEDSRDAKDSVRHLDGTRVCGVRIRAEMSNGRSRRDGNGGGRRHDDRRDRSRSRSRSPVARRDRKISRSRSRSCSRSRTRSASNPRIAPSARDWLGYGSR